MTWNINGNKGIYKPGRNICSEHNFVLEVEIQGVVKRINVACNFHLQRFHNETTVLICVCLPLDY